MNYFISSYKTVFVLPLAVTLISCGGSSNNNSSTPVPTNTAGTVSVSGTTSIGETLTSTVVDANGTSGSTFVYQWLRSGATISGATSGSYSPVSDDVGNPLSVRVNYTDDDGFSENITSAATANVTDPTPANTVGNINISGTAQVGQLLSASVTDSNGLSGSVISYQWQAGSTDIAGATNVNFIVTSDQVGDTLRVLASYTDDDGNIESLTSASTTTVPIVVETFAGNFQRGTLGDNDTVPDINCDTIFTSTSELEDAATRTMTLGTTLCLADGNYNGLELDFGGAGTEADPITIAAVNPGSAVIGGDVSVRMSGTYAVLQGLVFKDGESASSDFLQTRNGSGGDFCNNCRITEVSIIDVTSDNSGKWLNIYGQDNRIDHSWFSGKSNTGALLIINREVPDGATAADVLPNRTIIDHNYFGDRPPTDGKAYAESSDNDYEAIRLGTSDAHAFDSHSVVEYNYFERIEGEAEVISNKSGNNLIVNNTIRDSYGSLTTRHGSEATISGNVILGDGHPFAGGIRVVDDGHRIINNYIGGARYKNTRFHGGIVLHNSNGSTSNGYQTFENVLVMNNTIVDSVNSLNVNGGNQSDNPESVFFINNIIDDAIGPIITFADEGLPANSTFAGNYIDGQSFSDEADLTSAAGFIQQDAMLEVDSLGIARPTAATATALAAEQAVNIGSFNNVNDDMDGQDRPIITTSGSDHISTEPAIRGLLSSGDVGPINYTPDFSQGYVQRVSISNSGFDSGEADWTFTSPATITEVKGDVFSGETVSITDAGEVSRSVSVIPNSTYTLSAFTKGPIQLGVDVGGTEIKADESGSEYELTTVSFDSGSASSIEVFARLDDQVSSLVSIGDPTFVEFTGNTSDLNWVVTEGGTLGQVQTTGNSASGPDGALKFRLNEGSGEIGGMGVTQFLADIAPNTDYTLEAFVLNKRDFDVTATIGVYEAETTTVLASKVLDYAALESAGADESESDSFLRDEFTFNSGLQTGLTLFVTYNVNTVYADGGDQSDTELWVDDISISFNGAPATDSIAFVDEFRLVAHGN